MIIFRKTIIGQRSTDHQFNFTIPQAHALYHIDIRFLGSSRLPIMTFLKLPLILAGAMVLRSVDAACIEDNCYRGERPLYAYLYTHTI